MSGELGLDLLPGRAQCDGALPVSGQDGLVGDSDVRRLRCTCGEWLRVRVIRKDETGRVLYGVGGCGKCGRRPGVCTRLRVRGVK